MSTPVGADIESICNKCGDVWHVVVAKVGDKIAKVQCKQCGGYHRYRPPAGTKGAATARRAATPRAAARKDAAPRPSMRIEKPLVEPDSSRPIRPYDFRGEYQPGDRLEHPSFGIGVVEVTSEPGKMQVFFSDGRRVLALAKPESRLERPQPFRHENGGTNGE